MYPFVSFIYNLMLLQLLTRNCETEEGLIKQGCDVMLKYKRLTESLSISEKNQGWLISHGLLGKVENLFLSLTMDCT